MRPLSQPLEEAMASPQHRPAYKLLAYDTTRDSIGAIVRGEAIQTPLILTPYASEINWSPDKLTFTLVDPDGRFDPDLGQYRNHLRYGSVVRLLEGDESVEESDWIVTFTGLILYQIGWTTSRATGTRQSRVTVYNRGYDQPFNRRKITTKEYTVGTEAGVVLRDVLKTFFGLTELETRIPPFLGFQFLHNISQLVQVTPWEAVKVLLEVVSGVPFFDGDGRIAYYTKDTMRQPDLVLPDWVRILDYTINEATTDGINRVIVQFLSANMEPVEGPDQCLGAATVTTGFFTDKEVIPCYWSEDRRLRARNTRMKVIKSVNSNLLPVGKESYRQVDDFHGEITIIIYKWVPILITVLMVDYIASQMIKPDYVIVPPFGGYVPTIPVGRMAAALDLIGILIIMASLGSAQYEVWGIPFEYAYVEKQVIAEEDGLQYWQINEKKIENDLFGSFEQAKPVAINELIWEHSLIKSRRLRITNYPALEPGDLIELPTRKRLVVTNLSKQIKRGEVPVMQVDGFIVSTDIEAGILEL